jgi:hypothetical protein
MGEIRPGLNGGEATSPRYPTTPHLRSRRLELRDREVIVPCLNSSFFGGGVTTAGFVRGGSYGTTFGHDLQRNALTPGGGLMFLILT